MRRADALQVLAASAVVDGQASVRLAGPHGQLQVTVRVERVPAEGLTCANPRPGYFLAYQPVRIDPVG